MSPEEPAQRKTRISFELDPFFVLDEPSWEEEAVGGLSKNYVPMPSEAYPGAEGQRGPAAKRRAIEGTASLNDASLGLDSEAEAIKPSDSFSLLFRSTNTGPVIDPIFTNLLDDTLGDEW